MAEQVSERDPYGPEEEAHGGGFGRMGGQREEGGGYGRLAAAVERGSTPEESGAGAYGALYGEAAEATPGGYGELSRSDEDEEEHRIGN